MEATQVSIKNQMDKDMVNIYKGILATEKDEILPLAELWTDLEGNIQKKTNTVTLLYVTS